MPLGQQPKPPVLAPSTQQNQSLALGKCDITATVWDVFSWITLSQQFHNPTSSSRNRFTYIFSMLAGSAIYNFEMVRGNGEKITGLVKEKQQAQKELEAALSAGKAAALGEEQTKDVFSIEVGNIDPNETVTINLSYFVPLYDDEDRNQLRWTLPRTYMQRYGTPPTDKLKNGHYEDVPFTLNISIQQKQRITSVTSNSGHQLVAGQASANGLVKSYTVRRTSSAAPSTDVIIVISADGLDKPRGFVESHPDPKRPTAAIAVTLVPTIKPIDSPLGMEFIMLVDRSGSMNGSRMKMTQDALQFLIKNLPTRLSSFNFFSYGTKVDSLWPQSKPYDVRSVNEASRYIRGMTANYGGTEIGLALDAAFKSLPAKLTKPATIFLFTDGGAWNVKECQEKVEKAIKEKSTKDAFLRVFTIGIGDGVSTDTVEGIARAGGGPSIYLTSANEPYTGKCLRLVRAARLPPITEISINWLDVVQDPGPPTDPGSGPIDIYDPDADEDIGLGPPGSILETSPDSLPNFFASVRSQVYAFVPKPKKAVKPDAKLLITGIIPALKDLPVEFEVDLSEIKGISMLNTITARAIVTEWEDGRIQDDPSQAPKRIVALASAYNLSSRYTSFLAVSNGTPVGAAAPATRSPATSYDDTLPPWNPSGGTRGEGETGGEGAVYGTQGVLNKLVELQSFDGSYAEEAQAVFKLLNPRGGDSISSVYKQYNLADGVSATVLAWAWLYHFAPIGGLDLRLKSEDWIRENAPGVDVTKLFEDVLNEVAFEDEAAEEE